MHLSENKAEGYQNLSQSCLRKKKTVAICRAQIPSTVCSSANNTEQHTEQFRGDANGLNSIRQDEELHSFTGWHNPVLKQPAEVQVLLSGERPAGTKSHHPAGTRAICLGSTVPGCSMMRCATAMWTQQPRTLESWVPSSKIYFSNVTHSLGICKDRLILT